MYITYDLKVSIFKVTLYTPTSSTKEDKGNHMYNKVGLKSLTNSRWFRMFQLLIP